MNTDSHTVRRTRSENAEFVVASIKALGFQPNSESRLERIEGGGAVGDGEVVCEERLGGLLKRYRRAA